MKTIKAIAKGAATLAVLVTIAYCILLVLGERGFHSFEEVVLIKAGAFVVAVLCGWALTAIAPELVEWLNRDEQI